MWMAALSIALPFLGGGGSSQQDDKAADGSDTSDSGICIFTLIDVLIITCYVLLFLQTMRLLYRHRLTVLSGELNGLVWYLACTAMLCLFRTCAFSIIPFTNRGESCDMKYSYLEWDIGGAFQARNAATATTTTELAIDSNTNTTGTVDGSLTSFTTSIQLELIQLILSSSSSGLFFTSYSYFASSLAKVIDMLTGDYSFSDIYADTYTDTATETGRYRARQSSVAEKVLGTCLTYLSPAYYFSCCANSSSAYIFFLVLLGQNICVWLTIVTLWVALLSMTTWINVLDDAARVLVCIAALSSGTMFFMHFYRATVFLTRYEMVLLPWSVKC
jgi:fumarate reductase subunit C